MFAFQCRSASEIGKARISVAFPLGLVPLFALMHMHSRSAYAVVVSAKVGPSSYGTLKLTRELNIGCDPTTIVHEISRLMS